MITARRALLAHVRVFVETELAGLYRYDDMAHHVPERSDAEAGKRPNLYGKFREAVSVTFGNYQLTVESPHEKPPLGWVTLRCLGSIEEGPLDPVTWGILGSFVRQRTQPQRTAANG